jgi:hypothetical protein
MNLKTQGNTNNMEEGASGGQWINMKRKKEQ